MASTQKSTMMSIPETCLIITHALLIQGGADYVYESPLGESSLVIYIHNPSMHCATSQCAFKPRDVIMMHAITNVAAQQQHRPPHRYNGASLSMTRFTNTQQRNGTNYQFEKYVTTSNSFVLN